MSATPRYALVAALALFIGFNLRPLLAAISPLLDMLQNELGMSSTLAGLLTTLPIMLMGVFALTGPSLQARLGEVRGIALGMLLVVLASACRPWIDTAMALVVSAAVAGVGIALVQALMPAWLKRHHPQRAGTLMGLFTTGIMSGAVVSATVAAPAAEFAGWRLVLGAAAVPALLGLLAWLACAGDQIRHARGPALPWSNTRAWLLLMFFGIGTSGFTLVLAWLPASYIDLGFPAAYSGYLLGGVSGVEVVAGVMVSTLIHRFPDRRPLLTVVIGLMLAGFACLIFAPAPLALPAVVLLGLSLGALFPLSLIVTLDHAHSPAEAGALLAFVQGGGYIIAAIMPLVAGVFRDHTGSLDLAWICMLAAGLVLLVMTWRLGQPVAKPAAALDTAG